MAFMERDGFVVAGDCYPAATVEDRGTGLRFEALRPTLRARKGGKAVIPHVKKFGGPSHRRFV